VLLFLSEGEANPERGALWGGETPWGYCLKKEEGTYKKTSKAASTSMTQGDRQGLHKKKRIVLPNPSKKEGRNIHLPIVEK